MPQPKVIRFSVVLLAFLFPILLLSGRGLAAALPNGLQLENADPNAAQGIVGVLGVADHPTFRKWQLDLLLGGTEPVFLALGEERMVQPGLLTALDTRLYPDGAHSLRLRVVYARLNYDEFLLPLQIVNQSNAPSQTRRPDRQEMTLAPTAAPEPMMPGNGLSLVTQGNQVSVRGVADHPTFRKWQVDLLVEGDANRPLFLAVGEERTPNEKELVAIDPADYPAGGHQLRLRVVYGNLNYDEYFLPLSIGPASVLTETTAVWRGSLLVRGPGDGKAVYLTFDDGPHPVNTPQILQVLAEYNAKATFFMVGSYAQGKGDLLKEIYEAGHAIGNHTWGHRRLDSADWESFQAEVDTTAKILAPYGSPCLRPPYGEVGPKLIANAKEAGYTLVMWSVDSLDWSNQNPQTIVKRVLPAISPGAIILFHDGGDSRRGTGEALATILAALTAEGYTFPALCR